MLNNIFDLQRPLRYAEYGRMSTGEQNRVRPTSSSMPSRRRSGRWDCHGPVSRSFVTMPSARGPRQTGGLAPDDHRHPNRTLDVDVVLVMDADRWGREDEAYDIRRRLFVNYGVLVLTADTGFSNPTTSEGELFAMFDSWRAKQESRVKGRTSCAARGRDPSGSLARRPAHSGSRPAPS